MKTGTRQIFSWLMLALFVAGFFFHPIGIFTGIVLGLWLVGTQRPSRGFEWVFLFALASSVLANWRALMAGTALVAIVNFKWLLLGAGVAALPFLIHRLASTRFTGFATTLIFPACSVVIPWSVATAMLSPGFVGPGLHLALGFPNLATPSQASLLFARAWMGSALIWAWERDFRFFAASRTAAMRRRNERDESLALLRSPVTGESLQFRGASLVTASGEHFPILRGIPVFLRPQEITGANRKYNHLYQTIGGFYDDSQRVFSALTGMDRDTYVMGYLGLLEVKPGDRILETSVGTGLNFKYLPRDICRFGVDLSSEMLARCQANLRLWGMDADLFLANAEALPFADESFDVVFHVGGINFFSDRAAAISEMIRVARPGSLLLIADETEEHVKAAYENIPYTREFFKSRTEAVSAPIDLLPPDMKEVQLTILEIKGKRRFYALTFRKPPKADEQIQAATSDVPAVIE